MIADRALLALDIFAWVLAVVFVIGFVGAIAKRGGTEPRTRTVMLRYLGFACLCWVIAGFWSWL